MRNLDPSISDVQIRAIYASLKNDAGEIPIADLVRNFTGQPFETVDYRNTVFKKVDKKLTTFRASYAEEPPTMCRPKFRL